MIEIFDCAQGSSEWYACRLGVPTASEFASILAKGRGAAPSKTRQTYLHKLVGERLTGQPMERTDSKQMERGRMMEPEAIAAYEMLTDVTTTKVGFVRNGELGCSPDRLIGENGGAEVKSKLPHLQIACILDDILPEEHEAQVHGCIWLCDREWWDFISYCPGLPLFVKRVYRDEDYIKLLKEATDKFLEDMQSLIEKLKSQGA